jgi:hypothetical protein
VKKYVNYGASVRAAQFLVLAAKARALMKGRYHVTYEDIRALYIPVLRHRILLNFHAESDRLKQDDILKRLLDWKGAPQKFDVCIFHLCLSVIVVFHLWFNFNEPSSPKAKACEPPECCSAFSIRPRWHPFPAST